MKVNEIVNVDPIQATFEKLMNAELVGLVEREYCCLLQDTNNLKTVPSLLFEREECLEIINRYRKILDILSKTAAVPAQTIQMIDETLAYFDRY